jgi:ribosomal protein S13
MARLLCRGQLRDILIMAKEINEDMGFNISLKTLGGIGVGMASLIGMWFTLQADIAEAKELPVPPDPEITRMEFDMKDQLVRQTIMSTQQDVTEIKEDIKRIEEKIDQLK